jgi:hypothetical protein
MNTEINSITTLGDLAFEKFAPKDETKVSVALPFETFLGTKQLYKSNTPIPHMGVQILQGVNEILSEIIPDNNRSWGNIYVYRNQYSAPDYVKKLTGSEPANIKLLGKDTPISDLHFGRFIGTIDLISDGQHSERIAIKCDENKSIELAIGLNVHVCDNFTLFGKNLMTTNTRENRGFEWIMDQIRQYATKIQEKFAIDLATIRRLQDLTMSEYQINDYVGELLMRYETKEEVLPVTMITNLTRKLKEKKAENAWDLLNAGTETVRFDSNTGDSTLQTMELMANHVVDRFGIPYEFSL